MIIASETSKERLIRVTARLIKHKGYYGVGLNEVLSISELPKGSLYHHFPGGKDDLISAALIYAAEEQALAFKNAMKGKGSPEMGLQAVVDVLIQEFERSGVTYGCPLASVALDVANTNPRLRDECIRQFEFWIESIRNYLEYKSCDNAAEKARRFMTALEGAIVLSKIWQNNSHLEKMKADIHLILKA